MTGPANGPVEVRRGADAFRTELVDRTTVHAFSFGRSYDPANLGFGPMICHNDDRVAPGGGYPEHGHADLEIVTWVLDGELTHAEVGDPGGAVGLAAGTVQVTSAGDGIRHSETVAPDAPPTRFLQVWLRPDEPGGPSRTVREVPGLDEDGLVQVVGGPGPGVGVRGAGLHVARLRSGVPVVLPDAPLLHVYVARGSAELEGAGLEGPGTAGPAAPAGRPPLLEGDAWRLRDAGERRVTPRGDGAELVVWSFGAAR